MATEQKRVSPQAASRDIEHDGEVGTMASMGMSPAPREIEVDPISTPAAPRGVPMVQIRVNTDIEEMTMVHQGRKESYTFQAGNRYMVPGYIAHELEALGKIWH